MASHGVPRQAQQAVQKDAAQIEAYKSLVAQVQAKLDLKEYTAETLFLTTNLLHQNPEYYTIWNYRRLILQHAIQTEISSSSRTTAATDPTISGLKAAQHEISLIIKEDLAFLIPLIKETPKCYWIWNHRRWLLRQANELLTVAQARQFWEGEMLLDSKMLSYDSRNFHGWSYRREIASALEACNGEQTAQQSVIETEFAYTTQMIRTNLSNFSAWHNRSRLLAPLMNERKADGTARRHFMDQEMQLITQALYTDPFDQSLWFYHQCLIDVITAPLSPLGEVVPDLTDDERIELMDAQLSTLQDMLEDADDCKWIYQYLVTYQEIRQRFGDATSLDADNTRAWLQRLQELDPLRRGRWNDWAKRLAL